MEEIAAVYARSLFEVATEQGIIDEIHEQLADLSDVLSRERDLQVFFFSPDFSVTEKQDGMRRMLDGAHPVFINFLNLLIEKHRMPVIFRTRRAFDGLWDAEHQMLPVDITSAIELDHQTTERIGEQIGESTGRRVQLTTHVEPEIIGGLVLRVGNSILDASIRNRLEQLRKQVATGH